MDAKHLQRGENQRRHYLELMSLLKMLAILAVALLIVLMAIEIKPQKQHFYAVSGKGLAVLPLAASNEPTLTLDYVLRWAKIAVRRAYNFNFNNYDTVLQSIKPSFTSGAYQSFIDAVNTSDLLSTIRDKQLLMTAIVPSTPVVLFKGPLHNRYTWTIQMPLLLNFESASVPNVQKSKIVTLTVSRVPAIQAPESGLEISRFYIKGSLG